MNYISRHAESAVEKLAKMFGAVLVAGKTACKSSIHGAWCGNQPAYR